MMNVNTAAQQLSSTCSDVSDKVLLQRALAYLVEATSTLECLDRPRFLLRFKRRLSHEAVLEAMRELSIDAEDYLVDFVNHFLADGTKMQCLAMRGPEGVVRSVIFKIQSAY